MAELQEIKLGYSAAATPRTTVKVDTNCGGLVYFTFTFTFRFIFTFTFTFTFTFNFNFNFHFQFDSNSLFYESFVTLKLCRSCVSNHCRWTRKQQVIPADYTPRFWVRPRVTVQISRAVWGRCWQVLRAVCDLSHRPARFALHHFMIWSSEMDKSNAINNLSFGRVARVLKPIPQLP